MGVVAVSDNRLTVEAPKGQICVVSMARHRPRGGFYSILTKKWPKNDKMTKMTQNALTDPLDPLDLPKVPSGPPPSSQVDSPPSFFLFLAGRKRDKKV